MKIKPVTIQLAILMFMALPVMAQARFIDAAYGARPAGMGEAFVSIADDADAALFNPAGFSRIDNFHLIYMYADLFSGLNIKTEQGEADPTGYHFLAAAIPIDGQIGYFGLAWLRLDTAIYKEDTLTLSYARRLWQGDLFQMPAGVSAGVSGKVLGWHVDIFDDQWYGIESTSKWGGSVDAGLLLNWSDHWRAGVALENAVPVNMGLLEKEYVPSIWRAGLAYDYHFFRTDYLDSILGTIEYDKREDTSQFKAGVETWWLNKTISLRAGVNNDQFTGGLSVVYRLPGGPLKIQLDYAYALPFQVYDSIGTHRFGLTLLRDSFYWTKQDKLEKAVEKRKNQEEETANQVLSLVKAEQTIAHLSQEITQNALLVHSRCQEVLGSLPIPEIEEYINYADQHIRQVARQGVTAAHRAADKTRQKQKWALEQPAINQAKLQEIVRIARAINGYAAAAKSTYDTLQNSHQKAAVPVAFEEIKLDQALENIALTSRHYKKMLTQSYESLEEIRMLNFKIKENALGSQKFAAETGLIDCSELFLKINQHANKAYQALLEALQVLNNKIATAKLIQQTITQARLFKINQSSTIVIGFERRYLSAFYDFSKMSQLFKNLTAYIERHTKYHLKVLEYIYGEDLKADFLAGNIDLVISDNQTFQSFYQSKTAEPIATFLFENKDYQNEWLFYQNTQVPKAVTDFKNKRIGYLNSRALACLKHNVNNYQLDYFKEFKHIHDAKSAVLALCLKEVDAVVSTGYLMNVYKRVVTAAPTTLAKIPLAGSVIPNPPIYRRTMMNQAKLKQINKVMKLLDRTASDTPVDQFFNFLKIDGLTRFDIQKYKKHY